MATETKNLKLYKYDKEADAEKCVDIDEGFNENWDKVDDFAGIVNDKVTEIEDNIESNQLDILEQIEKLQNKNALLESQFLTGQATGENITIKDSSTLQFKSFNVIGNMKQETSEASSNILDRSKLTAGFINANTGDLEGVNSTYPNATYTSLISLKVNDTLNLFNLPVKGARIRVYNTDGTYNSSSSTNTSYTAIEACLVRVLFLDTVLENTMIKINDTDTTYEEFSPNMPSIDYPSEIQVCGDDGNITVVKSNKNILDSSLMTKTAGINFIDIKLKPNTNYTFSSNIPKTYDSQNAYIFATNKQHGYSTAGNGVWEGQNRTVLSDSEGYISLAYRKDSNINSLSDYWYQIEEGEKATEYVAHEGKTYIIPTQKPFFEKDTFVKINGVRYEKHVCKIVDLSTVASNNFYKNSTNTTEKNRWGTNYFSDVESNSILYCTHLKNVTQNETYSCEEGISISDKTIFLYIEDVFDYTSLNNFLSKAPLLYYKTINPVLIKCTSEQNAILDEIESDENYKNITHIYSEDEIEPNIEVKYYKDQETTQKNLEDRISKIEELLSTTETSAMLLDNYEKDLLKEV